MNPNPPPDPLLESRGFARMAYLLTITLLLLLVIGLSWNLSDAGREIRRLKHRIEEVEKRCPEVPKEGENPPPSFLPSRRSD